MVKVVSTWAVSNESLVKLDGVIGMDKCSKYKGIFKVTKCYGISLTYEPSMNEKDIYFVSEELRNKTFEQWKDYLTGKGVEL